jgi:hypothetical protein
MIMDTVYLLWLFVANLHSAPTNEVHNLNLVLVAQHRIRPLTTTHNFAIDFDRDSRGRQIEFGD